MRSPSRAPLQPLPVVGTPFERLGMDIVGPVEKSRAGNRFMLVITDYATRYPEVFPMKSIKAKHVATCLKLFSRVWFPFQILTDRDPNSRITPWYLAMQPFRFGVQFVPGKANATSDFLSRCVSKVSEVGGSVMADNVATQQGGNLTTHTDMHLFLSFVYMLFLVVLLVYFVIKIF